MKDSKIIQEEIKSLSDTLALLHHHDALKNMEQSFVDKESDIIKAIQSDSINKSELVEFSFDKTTYLPCFTVPENYFSSNEEAILQKIDGNHKKVKVIAFPKIFSYAVAASVVMFLGLTLVRYYGNNELAETAYFDEIGRAHV